MKQLQSAGHGEGLLQSRFRTGRRWQRRRLQQSRGTVLHGTARCARSPSPGPAPLRSLPALLLVGCGAPACRIYRVRSRAGDRPLVSNLLLGTFDRRAAGSQRPGRAQPPAPGSRRAAPRAERPALPGPLAPPPAAAPSSAAAERSVTPAKGTPR